MTDVPLSDVKRSATAHPVGSPYRVFVEALPDVVPAADVPALRRQALRLLDKEAA
ncbi:MAG: hypothetical protein WBF81_01610 [Thermoplasmata archaeon]